MASHTDYYETLEEMATHNTAAVFPQVLTGDSWVGALCSRHQGRAKRLFAGCYAVRCANPACPAECCVCAGELAPREAVA